MPQSLTAAGLKELSKVKGHLPPSVHLFITARYGNKPLAGLFRYLELLKENESKNGLPVLLMISLKWKIGKSIES